MARGRCCRHSAWAAVDPRLNRRSPPPLGRSTQLSSSLWTLSCDADHCCSCTSADFIAAQVDAIAVTATTAAAFAPAAPSVVRAASLVQCYYHCTLTMAGCNYWAVQVLAPSAASWLACVFALQVHRSPTGTALSACVQTGCIVSTLLVNCGGYQSGAILVPQRHYYHDVPCRCAGRNQTRSASYMSHTRSGST